MKWISSSSCAHLHTTLSLTDMIRGDSYSDIGWVFPDSPMPTRAQPLGLTNPGQDLLWVKREWQDNWVRLPRALLIVSR